MNKVKVIEGVVNIPMAGGFYGNIQKVVNELIAFKPEEELKVCYQNIKDKKPLSDYEKALETMFIFCATYEKLAEEQGKIKEVDIEELAN